MRALFVGGELTAAELLDLLGQRLRLALRPLVQPRQALDELRGALPEITGGGLQLPQPLGELLPLEATAVKLLLDVKGQAQVLLELLDPLLAAVDALLEQLQPVLDLAVALVEGLHFAGDGVDLVLQAESGLQVAGAAIRELFDLPRQGLVRETELSH